MLNGRLPVEVGQLIRHVVQINPIKNSAASEQAHTYAFETIGAPSVQGPTIRP
jgi:hypothetical protein